MYKNLQHLDKVAHASLRFNPSKDYAFAKESVSVPLGATEIGDASTCFPILFSVDGPVTPLAVMGLTGTNVFLDANNRWTAPYLPLAIRRYPFILAKNEQMEGLIVTIDADAPQWTTNEGIPLFEENGEASNLLKEATKLLEGYQQSVEMAHNLFADLETSGVLVSKEITIKDGSTTRVIGGFRIVDEEKMQALDDATLARWARNGLLAVIHAHWVSLRYLNAVAVASDRPQQVQ